MKSASIQSPANNSSLALIEPLEDRTLLSASWTTLTQLPTNTTAVQMTADSMGNIYALDVLPSAVQERKPGSSAFTTIYQSSGSTYPKAIATDPAGNVFVGTLTGIGGNVSNFRVYERRAGGTTFSPIGSPISSIFTGGVPIMYMTTDASGDVYVAANTVVNTTVKKKTTSTPYGMVFKLAPHAASPTGYDESTIYQAANISLRSITATGSGASTSVIAAGLEANHTWITLKGANAGATWSQVDAYLFDPSAATVPTGIVADGAGHIYVAGYGEKLNVGNDWIVRKSSDGGATWTTDDDFVLGPAVHASDAFSIAIDPSGAVFVGGGATDASGTRDSVIRTNAGGSWSTSLVKRSGAGEGDARGYCIMTADTFGNVFAAGTGASPIIHELPAAPALLLAAPDPLQPSTQINLSFTNRNDPDATGLQLFRSANGGPFTAIATLPANATSFTDSNLSPNTTYSYYLVSLLNQDGSSYPSNILTLATNPANP